MVMQDRCNIFGNDFLSRYLDQEPESEAIRQVQSHLKDCPICRRELNELQEARSALSEISKPPETPQQWPLIRNRLQNGRKRIPLRLRWLPSWRRLAPIAAGIFLSILAVGLFWSISSKQSTDVEPYLGLYLLAANASDVISSGTSPEKLAALKLGFVPRVPASINSWSRTQIYYHKLHGQPVLQVFYQGAEGTQYCIFQQTHRHSLDFGNRQIQQELVQNQICTKLSDQHFNLVSWERKGIRLRSFRLPQALICKRSLESGLPGKPNSMRSEPVWSKSAVPNPASKKLWRTPRDQSSSKYKHDERKRTLLPVSVYIHGDAHLLCTARIIGEPGDGNGGSRACLLNAVVGYPVST